MKSKQKKLLYWLCAIVGLVAVLGVVYFLFKNFYHQPVLVNMIDNVDVVGYLEWEGDKGSDIYDHLLTFEDGLIIPPVSTWENRLHCSLVTCGFWGKSNAIVLRKADDGVFPELYFYQANKTELLNAWQELTKGGKTLTMFDHTYHIVVRDDVILITFRSISDAPVVLGSQSISKMPWIMNKPIPTWGSFIGFGFCQTVCIDSLGRQFVGKIYDKFPLVSAFLDDTIHYTDFLIIPEKNRLKIKYSFYFTPTYVSPVVNETKQAFLHVFDNDTYVLSGDKLKSKITILQSDGQNMGLWKTVMTLGQNELMSEAWLEILQQIDDYPYELHLRSPLTESIVILDISSDFSVFKEKFKTALIHAMPIIFPQIQDLRLPDSTEGMELVKNNNISVHWISNNADEDFIITVYDNTRSIFSIYGKKREQKVRFSLSPLKQESERYCLASGTSDELQALQLANPTLPLLWWNVRSISSQEVAGELFFDRSPPSGQCV